MEVKNFMPTLRIAHNIIPVRLLTSEMLCCVVWCTHINILEKPCIHKMKMGGSFQCQHISTRLHKYNIQEDNDFQYETRFQASSRWECKSLRISNSASPVQWQEKG
jgi:hypothetical protein